MNKGDKGKAICSCCGIVTTTYEYKDLPIKDSTKIVLDILVGVCDNCKHVISIPAQSTQKIKEQL